MGFSLHDFTRPGRLSVTPTPHPGFPKTRDERILRGWALRFQRKRPARLPALEGRDSTSLSPLADRNPQVVTVESHDDPSPNEVHYSKNWYRHTPVETHPYCRAKDYNQSVEYPPKSSFGS